MVSGHVGRRAFTVATHLATAFLLSGITRPASFGQDAPASKEHGSLLS